MPKRHLTDYSTVVIQVDTPRVINQWGIVKRVRVLANRRSKARY